MKPLIVLLVVFILAVAGTRLIFKVDNLPLCGCIAMAAMLAFTGMGHFAFTKGMAMMIPEFIPYKIFLVYLTGAIEILFAAGLLIQQIRIITGVALIVFLIVMLPANISAAIRKIDYQKGTTNGSGPPYLWFRVPLQIFFIAWVYFSAVSSV